MTKVENAKVVFSAFLAMDTDVKLKREYRIAKYARVKP